MNSTLLNRVTMVLSLFGVFVTGVLSYSHAAEKEVPCAANATVNCAAVVNSPAGSFYGIPVAYLGLICYLLLFGLAWFRVKATGKNWVRAANASLILTGIGFGFHLFLQVVSLNVLQQLCYWCLTSAVNMLIAFIVHGMLAQSGEPTDEKGSKIDVTVAAAAAILAVGAFGITTTMMQKEAKFYKDFKTELTNDQILPIPAKMKGNKDAKIVIIEFADMLCPTCRSTSPKFEALYKKHSGKIRIGFRQFPLFNLPGHEMALTAAMIAEFAAEKERFWEFVNRAYDEGNGERVKTEAGLLEIARESGLSLDELRPLLEEAKSPTGESRLLDKVNADFHLSSEDLKIKGTPTFLLIVNNGEPRALSFEELEHAFDEPEIKELLK
ncbi:MAG: vitamin K epoxide reductase family protein [Fimbriimonadaceae bacterium]|nr:MAG: vitamin K epoxide reductase family protein [Fimbriimonadaceae bacterium]